MEGSKNPKSVGPKNRILYRHVEDLPVDLRDEARSIFLDAYVHAWKCYLGMKVGRGVDKFIIEPCGGCGSPLIEKQARKIGSCEWCAKFTVPTNDMIIGAKHRLDEYLRQFDEKSLSNRYKWVRCRVWSDKYGHYIGSGESLGRLKKFV